MKPKQEIILGMPLDIWKFKSCEAHFGVGKENGEEFATLYDIVSKEPGKGHAHELLTKAKAHYKEQGRKVGGTIALNDKMRFLYRKVGIEEYL